MNCHKKKRHAYVCRGVLYAATASGLLLAAGENPLRGSGASVEGPRPNEERMPAEEAVYRVSSEGVRYFASRENVSYALTANPSSEGVLLRVRAFSKYGEEGARVRPLWSALQDIPEGAGEFLLMNTHEAALPRRVWTWARAFRERTPFVEEGVSAILKEVNRLVTYDASVREESAAKTWALKRGNCVGQVALAVALLRAAGVPARPTHGIYVSATAPYRSVPLDASMLHRWVEWWLPGRGWTFADPGHPDGTVGARYLPFAEAPRMADIKEILLVPLYTMLPAAPPDGGGEGSARRAGVWGTVVGGEDGHLAHARVELVDVRGTTRWEQRLEGRRTFVFTGLLPGESYALQFACPGYPPRRADFTAPPSGLHAVRIVLSNGRVESRL